MTLIFALGFAILFGAGSYLLLKHDLIRVVGGMILISNAANLFIMASGLTRGREPIYPLPEGETVADPLVQSMTLTAVVISFGVSALLMTIVYRFYGAHRSVDIEHLADVEERQAAAEELAMAATVAVMAAEGSDIEPSGAGGGG